MIRKIRDRAPRVSRDSASKTKARLRLMAYVGISQAETARLQPHMVNVDEGWIATGRRRKGKGVVTGKRPLTDEGIAALKAFIAAEAFGPFSRDAMAASFQRARDKVIAGLAVSDPALATELRRLRLRPYDLRHSYIAEVLEKSGDFHATQLLAGHGDLRTTLGYGQRAVNPALRLALDRVKAGGGFRAKVV
jgi:integrase